MIPWWPIVLFAFRADAADLLQPVFRVQPESGLQRYVTAGQFAYIENRSKIEGVSFRAVVTNQWQPGLIPIFALERKGQFELRRLPPRGQENITEPLFFALPPEDEPPAIAGRWKCVGTRGDGSSVYPDFEIASQGTNLAVRFDQGSEYRFAFVTQAAFVSNRIEMRIENVADRYEMTGSLNGGQLRGTWRQVDGRESGTWHAERDLPPFVLTEPTAALYEWRSESGSVRYRLESENVPGSTRAKTPLCRVWRAE